MHNEGLQILQIKYERVAFHHVLIYFMNLNDPPKKILTTNI